MTDKPLALHLAEVFEIEGDYRTAAELRRLHEVNAELVEALTSVVRVADRATVEFDAAKAVIAKATGEQQ
jgi:hypothetical protein